MHALILLGPGPRREGVAELEDEHIRFIDDLDRENRVVLGGDWKPTAGGFEAAYLVSCDSLDEARHIAASDPLVGAGSLRFEVVEWQLVGVNAEAVDRDSLLFRDE